MTERPSPGGRAGRGQRDRLRARPAAQAARRGHRRRRPPAVQGPGRARWTAVRCARRPATGSCPTTTARSSPTADTVIVPGTFRHPALVDGTIEPALAQALTGSRAPGSCPSAPGRSCWPPPGCSTGGGPPPTGCTPSGSGSCSRGSGSTRTCCSSTTATCSPRPATRPASTCACTWCAATTARRWPTAAPGAPWSPPWRDGGQSQFIERPLPGAGQLRHRADPGLGAAAPRRPR